MPEENEQIITASTEFGDAELEQWLTSVGDGAEITLPGLDIGVPPVSRKPGDQLHRDDDAPTGQEGNDDEPNDDEEEIEEAGTPQATSDFFEINGNRFAREDIERLYNFDQYMRSNPDVAERVNAAITGAQPTGQTTLPAPSTATPDSGRTEPPAVAEWQEPTPPDFLDLDDPQQKWQWDSHVAQQKVLFDQDQRQNAFFAQQAQEQQTRRNEQAARDMATALDSFKQQHLNLNEDDIAKVRKAGMPYLESMLKQLPGPEAISRAMEIGGIMDPDLRDKLLDTTVRTRSDKEKSRHRKARLGELSGSGRSAPRMEPTGRPAFSSDKEFLNALAAEFSEQMQR